MNKINKKAVAILCTLIYFSPIQVLANGITPSTVPNAELINEGRKLFFNETFNGNGRTCGTCHPANNNFTIDPEYIAKLPKNDPLFVAEYVPALSENFEKPELMRKLGLILENTNGFGDLENNFTMRSVSHTLGLLTSVTPATNDGTNTPAVERTGWSGDGSPVGTISDGVHTVVSDGSIRSFSMGAIIQHFPKSLGRIPGVDFRLPSEYELDALEAFMFSLGRQQEFDDLNSITLNNAIAEQGRLNYMGIGLPEGSLNCNACHFNGGANTDPTFEFPPAITPAAFEMTNRSFAPRVEELLDQPGDVIFGGQLPFDDGFSSGTNLFNAPPVIEAADTGAFFHANQIETVEGMVSFYASTRSFRDGSSAGPIVPLNGSQIANVAAFVRVLNADENSRQAIELIEYAQLLNKKKHKKINIKLAISEIKDAIKVLTQGRLHFADVIPIYKQAIKKLRKNKLHSAKVALQRARTVMINRKSY